MGTKKNTIEMAVYERQAEICQALSHPIRLLILDLVQEKERTCSELVEFLDLPKANITQHMNVLKKAGILAERREGTFKYHRLALPQIKEACLFIRNVLLHQTTNQKESKAQLIRSIKRGLK